MKTIVSYPTNSLLWHLYNNCGLKEKAVNGIIKTINQLNAGKLTLSSRIVPSSDCTVAEMLEDLHIDYED